jgi:hypothetical protein
MSSPPQPLSPWRASRVPVEGHLPAVVCFATGQCVGAGWGALTGGALGSAGLD